ncbi:MAG: TetR/AcrR family transcriptional regulator [Myxococcota bacterium]
MPEALRSIAPPKQARSEQTQQRLLAAAEALIAEDGLARVSVNDIVRRARSSVGGFYARFRDKDELLLALHERFIAQLDERLEERTRPELWEGATLAEIVRPAIAEIVAIYFEKQKLIAAFTARAFHSTVTAQQGLGFRRRLLERVSALALTRRGEIGHPQPERAISMGLQMLLGLMSQMVMIGELRVGGRALSRDEITAELTCAFLSYLQVE